MHKKNLRKELTVSANKTKYIYKNLIILIILILFIVIRSMISQNEIKKTGTYSNMEYNDEGGDLLGEEIRIVYTTSGYQGAIQFSGGEPSQLILVDITFHSDSLLFNIPTSGYKGFFKGKLSKGGIEGVLKFFKKGEKKISLKRGKSYWD